MNVSISQTSDLPTCLRVREIVFMQEQGVSLEDELDGLDPDCLHLLALDDGKPVGTARVHLEVDVAKIGRVCVLRSHRGKGLGEKLIRAAVTLAKAQTGVRIAKLSAQVQALPFYEKLGFTAKGPVYDDAGIDHRDMVMLL